MRTSSKHLLLTTTAVAFLAMGVGIVSARRLQISSTGIRIAWNALRFSERTGFGGPEAICPVTLEGTIHSSTISKVSGQLIGFITRAALSSATCRFSGGAERVRILNGSEEGVTNTLPWHVRYDSFGGTLPSVSSIEVQVIGASFLLTAVGATCLYEATAGDPWLWKIIRDALTGVATSIVADGTRKLLKKLGGILCPSKTALQDTGAITALGNTTSITVRLVL